ncbi:MAG TPA: TadE/TadG family type IV pilus assembly protein [Stellaceae bacterium]|jgi:Flp pilus assembly protein TadG|nr:TadE/TadG family type IV pilus assembly protein [Stellaceae bacterium]
MKLRHSIGNFVARLLRADDGLSAVEFALLLPVMAVFYLGGVQISMAVSTYRLVDLTANTVTNLVSQYTTISAGAQMPDILSAATQVMYPASLNDPNVAKNIKVVVSLIAIDKNGNATVTWSQTLNGTARSIGSKVTVPTSMDIANTNIVLGETTYAFTAPVDFLKLGTINLSSALYMVPRASTTINLTS